MEVYRSYNMNLLMAALEIKLRPFGDDGGSNSEIRSEGKSERSGEDLGKVSLPRTQMYSSSIWGVYIVIYESK
jgi:hypothetical protein